MAEEEETSRTAMLWPVDLKEQVRQRVGPRGLTDFTLEAVRAKLTGHDASQEELTQLRFDLKYAREYAQRAVDSLACAGSVEERNERLREIGVPTWVDVAGWPEWAAGLKRSDGSSPGGLMPEGWEPPDPTTDPEGAARAILESAAAEQEDSEADTPVVKEGPGLDEPAGQEPVSESTTVDNPVDTPEVGKGTHFEHPDHDADPEEWREYARSMGYQGADVDKKNRSQIRTMLGIPQPIGDNKPKKMRVCDPGCGEEFDVFSPGEFEKHLEHQNAPDDEEPESVRVQEAADLPHDVQSKPAKNPLFEKLQQQGAEMGYDIRPASEVLKPEKETTDEEAALQAAREQFAEDTSEPASDLESPEEDATPLEVRDEIALCKNHPSTELPCPLCCPTCQSELVDGECWECM